MMTNEAILEKLKRPAGMVDVVLDTDAFNEVDDQFALSYMLRSPEKLKVQAIYAAPFLNEKVASPGEGMEKSLAEIRNILSLCRREELESITYAGSAAFLPDECTPVLSDAAEDLVKRALAQPEGRPLYVIAIGAITNVASALLLNPAIQEKIVVVWLGGHARSGPNTNEFNLIQDVPAARVVFGCGVPLVQLPCMGVVSHLCTTGPELKQWIAGKNKLCDYLYGIVVHEEEEVKGRRLWSRIIWDVAAVAWLLDNRYTTDIFVHSCKPTQDGLYAYDNTQHLMRYVLHVDRDLIFEDLLEKLTR